MSEVVTPGEKFERLMDEAFTEPEVGDLCAIALIGDNGWKVLEWLRYTGEGDWPFEEVIVEVGDGTD